MNFQIKYFIFLPLFSIFFFQSHSQSKRTNDKELLKGFKPVEIADLEIPKLGQSDIVIERQGYSLLYNETHEQASWVAYNLTDEETIRKFQRTDRFIIDPLINTGSANDADYKGSGYDRGHLAPAGDMGWSAETMQESFYYSNISPQAAAFNRGIWKNLEEQVRTWANEYKSVFVVTGPILKPNLPVIGYNEVSVPKYYFKVILDYRLPEIKGIGFIMPNEGLKEQLNKYVVSIDSVETVTGIDFFPLLPDNQENVIERNLCFECWTWQVSKQQNYNQSQTATSQSVQCSGMTKAGIRCKNKTLNPSGYCYIHENQQK